MIKLTQKGEVAVSPYRKKPAMKRKKILDTRKDTDDIDLLDTEDILCDIENVVGIDEDGIL